MPGQAHARRGWVIFGGGEAVTPVAELDPAIAENVRTELNIAQPAIGYYYGFFSLFFLDLFTFEGRYVLMDKADERFLKLEDAEISRLAGKPIDQLGKPFFYRFPLGMSMIVLLVLGFCGRMYIAYREQVG